MAWRDDIYDNIYETEEEAYDAAVEQTDWDDIAGVLSEYSTSEIWKHLDEDFKAQISSDATQYVFDTFFHKYEEEEEEE